MIIDAHIHIRRDQPTEQWISKSWPGETQFGITAEDYMEKMLNCKPVIDMALGFGLFSLSSSTPEDMKNDNDYLIEVVKKYPKKFIGAGVIDPSWGEKAKEELKRFSEAGLRVVKIRFSSIHYHANNKAAQRIFAEIEKLGMLPICHTDWTHYSNPLIIGDLASMFPDLLMVMQHFGEYMSKDAISVCKKLDNVYVDTSALVHPKNVLTFLDEVSEDRILFASDTLSKNGGLQPQDALNRILCLELPNKLERKILGENTIKLLEKVGLKL